MAARTLPNLGLKAFYTLGEDGWKDDQDLGLLKLSVLVQPVVLSILAAEPGAPTLGDVHLLDETHATHPNEIIVWDGETGEEAWVYIEPQEGWKVYDLDSGLDHQFDGTEWIELIAGSGIADAPSDGSTYARKDGAWVDISDAALPAYRVGFFFTTAPSANEVLAIHTFTDDITFADDFAGAVGHVDTNPAATFTMSVLKNGAAIGSIAVSTSGVVTFATTGGAASFSTGDRMKITGPASIDAAILGGAFTFKGSYT